MKLDKMGKKISLLVTLFFSHFTTLGIGIILYTRVNYPPVSVGQMWGLSIFMVFTVFFGGFYFLTEEK